MEISPNLVEDYPNEKIKLLCSWKRILRHPNTCLPSKALETHQNHIKCALTDCPLQELHVPKKQAIECVALSGDCSFIGEERMQVENVNKEATNVKGEKKYRTMENEQGVVSTMGLAKVARQPCRA